MTHAAKAHLLAQMYLQAAVDAALSEMGGASVCQTPSATEVTEIPYIPNLSRFSPWIRDMNSFDLRLCPADLQRLKTLGLLARH